MPLRETVSKREEMDFESMKKFVIKHNTILQRDEVIDDLLK